MSSAAVQLKYLRKYHSLISHPRTNLSLMLLLSFAFEFRRLFWAQNWNPGLWQFNAFLVILAFLASSIYDRKFRSFSSLPVYLASFYKSLYPVPFKVSWLDDAFIKKIFKSLPTICFKIISHRVFHRFIPATFTEGGAQNFTATESKLTPREPTGVPTATTASTLGPPSLSVGNHLDIPQSNPNLLSPDVLSQRRGCLAEND